MHLTRRDHALRILLAAFCFGACGDNDASGPQDAAIDTRLIDSRPIDAGPDTDTATHYTFALTTAQELSPCANAGTSAAATAMVTIPADDSMIVVSDVTYTGLSGAATSAHIHANVAGMNGGVVLSFTSFASPFSRTFVAADYTAATGAPATFGAFVTSLRAGAAYINIHTGACLGGEIRGQIL